MATLRERLMRRIRNRRCKACGEVFARSQPYCPVCKTRKGGRGQSIPFTGGFVHGGGGGATPPEDY